MSQENPPVLESLYNKVAQGLHLIKKRLQHRYFCKICEMFKKLYLEENLRKADRLY